MANDKISVVVPIYNVAAYLDNCITSVATQSYDNFEVILVDDGSTDGTSEICDNYAAEFDFIKVLHQENQGVSVARNKGIELSTGDWVAFVDGDDQLFADALKNAVLAGLNTNVDIYEYRTINEKADGSTFPTYYFSEELVGTTISPKELINKYNYKRGAVWGNLYNADFLKRHNLRFIKGVINSQDSIFCGFAYHYARTIHFNDINFSFMKYRKGSASRSWDRNRIIKYSQNIVKIESEINHRGLDYKNSSIMRLSVYRAISSLAYQLSFFNDPEVLRLAIATIEKSSLYPISDKGITSDKTSIFLLNLSVSLFFFLSKLKTKIKTIKNRNI